MTSDELRGLADKHDIGALLAEQGMDIVRLLADAIDALTPHTQYCEALYACTCGGFADVEQVLARFATLGKAI